MPPAKPVKENLDSRMKLEKCNIYVWKQARHTCTRLMEAKTWYTGSAMGGLDRDSMDNDVVMQL